MKNMTGISATCALSVHFGNNDVGLQLNIFFPDFPPLWHSISAIIYQISYSFYIVLTLNIDLTTSLQNMSKDTYVLVNLSMRINSFKYSVVF